jgi:hypothetical protein
LAKKHHCHFREGAGGLSKWAFKNKGDALHGAGASLFLNPIVARLVKQEIILRAGFSCRSF